MSAPITVVCGFGRCGSSLTMQMLAAGGMPVHGEWPAYEDDEATGSNPALMATLPGKAVKMLDRQLGLISREYVYNFIWLDRDETEQARSAVKMMEAIGFPMDRSAVKIMARSYAKDRPIQLARLRSLPGSRLIRVRFEDLIEHPLSTVSCLADWLGLPLDHRRMVAQVRHRSPKCLPYLLELEQLAETDADSVTAQPATQKEGAV